MISDEAIDAYRVKLGMLVQEEFERRAIDSDAIAVQCKIEDLENILKGDRFPTIPEMARLTSVLGENLRITWDREGVQMYELTEEEWRLMRAIRAGSMTEFALYLAIIKGDQIKAYIEDGSNEKK